MYYLSTGLTSIIPIVTIVAKGEIPILVTALKTKKNKNEVKVALEESSKKMPIYKRLNHSREVVHEVKFNSGKLSYLGSQAVALKDSEVVSYGDLSEINKVLFVEDSSKDLNSQLKEKIIKILDKQSPLPISADIMENVAEKIIDGNLLERLSIQFIESSPYRGAFYLEINSGSVISLILREMVYSYGESQFKTLFGRAPMIRALLFMVDPKRFSLKTWPKLLGELGGKEAFEKLPEAQQKSIVYAYEIFEEESIRLLNKSKELSINIDFLSLKELAVVQAKNPDFSLDKRKVMKIFSQIKEPTFLNAFLSALEDKEFREFIHQKGDVSISKLTEELMKRKYNNIKPGGEGMALIAAELMMSENSFEKYQDEYIQAMEKLPFLPRHYPTVSGGTNIPGYSYESMDMGNPRGWVVGIETHCCQHLGSAGASCVKYAANNPDVSGMFRVMKNGKTKAQSWIWFHEESGTFVFDNIEVAGGSGIDELGEDSAQKIMDTYMAFIENELEPRKDLFGIKRVTVGLGYMEINLDLPTVSNPVTINSMKNGANVYSDARNQKLLKEFL